MQVFKTELIINKLTIFILPLFVLFTNVGHISLSCEEKSEKVIAGKEGRVIINCKKLTHLSKEEEKSLLNVTNSLIQSVLNKDYKKLSSFDIYRSRNNINNIDNGLHKFIYGPLPSGKNSVLQILLNKPVVTVVFYKFPEDNKTNSLYNNEKDEYDIYLFSGDLTLSEIKNSLEDYWMVKYAGINVFKDGVNYKTRSLFFYETGGPFEKND